VLNREIPFRKIMKLIRFRLSEIEQWIETSGKFPQANDDNASEDELFADDEAVETTGCADENNLNVAETGETF
jgi:hypothetical protein